MSVSETGLSADTVRQWHTWADDGLMDKAELIRVVVALAEEWERQAATIAKLEKALRYIECPSMGYPGGILTADNVTAAEQWVRDGNGLDENIRLALATCIRQAHLALRGALAGTGEETT